MADFNLAIPRVLQNEGGYSNVTGDTGGETYCGISRNNWPTWEGWSIVDANQPLQNNEVIDNANLASMVETFYQQNFWDNELLGLVNNQEVAGKLLDMSVNMGSYRAIIILQQSLYNDFHNAINIDGKVGKETLRTINQTGPTLMDQLRRRCVTFYEGLAEANPNDRQFLNNWLERARQ